MLPPVTVTRDIDQSSIDPHFHPSSNVSRYLFPSSSSALRRARDQCSSSPSSCTTRGSACAVDPRTLDVSTIVTRAEGGMLLSRKGH